jgi:hypothetical protein
MPHGSHAPDPAGPGRRMAAGGSDGGRKPPCLLDQAATVSPIDEGSRRTPGPIVVLRLTRLT